MDKSPDAFRTISEVAEWLGVQAHVLRFWESKFSQVKPVKRAGGRRYYRPADMQLLGGIKKLLHDDGLTIKGVQKTLREHGVNHVSGLSQDLCDVAADAIQESAAKDNVAGAGTVLPFKSAAAKSASAKSPSPDQDDPQPTQIDHVAKAEPADPSVDDGSGPEDTAPADMPADLTSEPAPPTPVSGDPVAPAAPEQDAPILPSFLHRPAPATPAAAPPEPPPEPAAEPVAAAKRAKVVEAPDPPDESELPYTSGPLALLAKMDRLDASQAGQIAPLAKQLQAWLVQANA